MVNVKKICFVVASPLTARSFLVNQVAALGDHYAVDIIVGAEDSGLKGLLTKARIICLGITRKVAPLADLVSLARLYMWLHRERYALVCSVNPKAGLLGMLAALMCGVPLRVHMFTGQVWATRYGWKRHLLKIADRLMARLATHVLADSPSQREFLVAEGVLPAGKISVLGSGSICGVDGTRFRPDTDRRNEVRNRLGVPSSAIVYLFLGRLNRDKGILDLAEAFAALADPHAWLLIVGPDEAAMRPAIETHLGLSRQRAVFVDFTDRPENFMAAADVFCLPSYREGFGMVIIEAAACGLPAIGSRIYGITDAIAEGVTGLLHRPGDVHELAAHMRALAASQDHRIEIGKAARLRALDVFSSTRLTDAWVRMYRDLLG